MASFVVRTDHKNLEYYKRPQKLSERQVRWMQELSQFNHKLEFKPGRLNVVADALSRRDQDLPKNDEDDRVYRRIAQIIKPGTILGTQLGTLQINEIGVEHQAENPQLQDMWQETKEQDAEY